MSARRPSLRGLLVKDGYMQHPFDAAYGVETSGLVAGRDMPAGHPHDRHNTAYYGIAPSVFNRLCRKWRSLKPPFAPASYSFFDIGAGMGRAMLLASQMEWKQVVGVELNPQLARVAARNLQVFEANGLTRCPTSVLAADALTLDFPTGPCLVYMFNPFGQIVLRRMLRHMAKAFADRPFELDILYANHECDWVIRIHKGFELQWIGNIHKTKPDDAADRRILLNQPEGEYGAWSYESCSIHRWRGKQ